MINKRFTGSRIDKQFINEELDDLREEKSLEREEEQRKKNLQEEQRKLEFLQNESRYKDLLVKYKSVWDKIKALEEHYKKTLADPEVSKAINVLEGERHQIHLDAIGIGQKIGKGSVDVIADILNKEGNLSEFGLPDFSIFNDLDKFDEWGGMQRNGATYLIYDLAESTIGDQYSPRPNIPRLII